MIRYKYTSKNMAGTLIEGEFAGNSLDELKSHVRKEGQFLVEHKVISGGSAEIRLMASVKLKDLAIFCRQFSVLFSAGVNISEAVHILGVQTKNKKLRESLEIIYDDIRKGKLLSEAMDIHDKVFPEFLRSMVKVGEVSGNLDLVMTRMAEYYEKNNKISNKVKSAMVYPMILGIMMVGVVGIMFTFVLPIFAGTLEGFGTELPAITRLLLDMSGFITGNLGMILMSFVVLGVIYFIWARSPGGRLTRDRWKLFVPIISTVNRKTITTRFSRSLGILLHSGISMLESIDIIAKLIGNRFVESRFDVCKEDVKKGFDLATSLKKVGLFSPLLIEMISVGQQTGQLDDMLMRTADFFDEEVEESVTRATTMIEPIMIIVLAVVVGTIIVSVMLPMVGMMEGAMGGM